MFTICPASGAISENDVNLAYGLGTNLDAYHGVTYYVGSSSSVSGVFPPAGQPLSLNMFYNTWIVGPPRKITFNAGESGTFKIPGFRNFIVVHVWGGGGRNQGGSGGGGAFRQFNYSLDGRTNYPTTTTGTPMAYSVGIASNGQAQNGVTNSFWNGKLIGGGGDCSPGDQYGGGGGGWLSQGGKIGSSGWYQNPGKPYIANTHVNQNVYNGASRRGSGYYDTQNKYRTHTTTYHFFGETFTITNSYPSNDGNCSPFGGGGGENGNPIGYGPAGGFAVFGGAGGALDDGGYSIYGGATSGGSSNGKSIYGGQPGTVPGGSGAGGRIDVYIDLAPPFDATADMIYYGAPPNQDAPATPS